MATFTIAIVDFQIIPTSTPNFYDVTSSNGWDHYPLNIEVDGGIVCGCLGFTHRDHCKHSDYALANLAYQPVEFDVVQVFEPAPEVITIYPVEVPGTDGKECNCSNCGHWMMTWAFEKHLQGRFCEVYGGVIPAQVAVVTPPAPAPVAPVAAPTEPLCVECGLFPAMQNSQVCAYCHSNLFEDEYDAYIVSMQPTEEEKAQENAHWKNVGLRDLLAAEQEREWEEELLAQYDALSDEEKERMGQQAEARADWQAEQAVYNANLKDNTDIFGIF